MWWRSRRADIGEKQVLSTSGINQNADPSLWREHFFGLSETRWDRLKKRSFWITGAGSGYGQAVALALAAAGSLVFITGRSFQKLEATKLEGFRYKINTENLIPVVADITSEADLDSAIKHISGHTKVLYGLINSAALPQPDVGCFSLSNISKNCWNELMLTNITAQWLTTRAALPLLTIGKEARVLYLTSEAGWADSLGFGPYNVSKSAVNSLGASFASECSAKYPEKDIQINVLVPGEARTEMNQLSFNSPFAVVSMVLALLSHPTNGPNGQFFHRDGRHLSFGYSKIYNRSIL